MSAAPGRLRLRRVAFARIARIRAEAREARAIAEIEALAGPGYGFVTTRKARKVARAARPVVRRNRAAAALKAQEDLDALRARTEADPVRLYWERELSDLAGGTVTDESLKKRLQRARRLLGIQGRRGRPRKADRT